MSKSTKKVGFALTSEETTLAFNKSYKRKGPCFISLKNDKSIKKF